MIQLALFDHPSTRRSSDWRLPDSLIRLPSGRFARKRLPRPVPTLVESLDAQLHVQRLISSKRKGRSPRSLTEASLWLAYWWGDKSALGSLAQIHAGMVHHILVKRGQGADDDARAELMRQLVQVILPRYSAGSGSIEVWVTYKLDNALKNHLRRTGEKAARQSVVVAAAQSEVYVSSRDGRDEDQLVKQAHHRTVIGSLHDLAGSAELPHEEWVILCVMLSGIADLEDVARHLGWPLARVEEYMARLRGSLAELGVSD